MADNIMEFISPEQVLAYIVEGEQSIDVATDSEEEVADCALSSDFSNILKKV